MKHPTTSNQVQPRPTTSNHVQPRPTTSNHVQPRWRDRYGRVICFVGFMTLGAMAAGCEEPTSADLDGYATRVSFSTMEEGVVGVFVTPSIVAQDAVLIEDAGSGSLLAAIVDDQFARTEGGRRLIERIEQDTPPVFLVTDLEGARDLGGALHGVASPDSWTVEIHGRDAEGNRLIGVTEDVEVTALAEFDPQRLDAYEATRSSDRAFDTRRHRTCCCRCGGQDCGCVTCTGPTCFCNCIACTASCDIVISG